jgi:hypothetical protein
MRLTDISMTTTMGIKALLVKEHAKSVSLDKANKKTNAMHATEKDRSHKALRDAQTAAREKDQTIADLQKKISEVEKESETARRYMKSHMDFMRNFPMDCEDTKSPIKFKPVSRVSDQDADGTSLGIKTAEAHADALVPRGDGVVDALVPRGDGVVDALVPRGDGVVDALTASKTTPSGKERDALQGPSLTTLDGNDAPHTAEMDAVSGQSDAKEDAGQEVLHAIARGAADGSRESESVAEITGKGSLDVSGAASILPLSTDDDSKKGVGAAAPADANMQKNLEKSAASDLHVSDIHGLDPTLGGLPQSKSDAPDSTALGASMADASVLLSDGSKIDDSKTSSADVPPSNATEV